jgi:DNA polymerase-3 subunit alpha
MHAADNVNMIVFAFRGGDTRIAWETLRKRAKMLKLRFSAKQLDQLVIDQLHDLFEANPGACQLHFTVFDPLDGIEVSLPSRSIKVQPSSQLFKELAKLDIQFKLN